MSFFHIFLVFLGFIFLIVCVVYAADKIKSISALKELKELDDCPFPFHVESDDMKNFLVFDLGEKTTLWCAYGFGIRRDGIYGVDELQLLGLNGRHCSFELRIGQSVFPLIERVAQFEDWAEKKSFLYSWDRDFREIWDEMKKNLDNLRYLETKSKEKDEDK